MNDEIKLVEYNHDMAEALVRMWEESREGWPPGFLGSSTKSPDSIRRHHEPGSFIHTTVAMFGDHAVGYIRTTRYGGETDAAYVALLNAVKDMHGKGIGKRLILDSLKRVTGKGFYRLDLHTWPANMKAVPLYKKTGFVWIPETSVYMQNYIPFILQRPEMRKFLENEDWYRCQIRDLDVEPDDSRAEGERRVFRYVFERGGARLEAEFDLAGRVLSAWKCPGTEISISRKIEKVFFGKSFRVYVNGKDLPDSVPVTGSDQVRTPDFVKISDEEGVFDAEPLPVDVPFDEHERAPRITLKVPGKKPLEIGLGVKADDAVSLQNLFHRMKYGEDFLKLELMRRDEIEKATLNYSIDSEKWESIEADVGRAVYSAVRIPVPELEPGLHNMKIRIDTEAIRGSVRSFHITRAPLDGTTGWIGEKYGILENNRLCLIVYRRSATASIIFSGREDASGQAGNIRLCAGPPLSQSDLLRQRFDLRFDGEEITAECDWPSKPGLRFVTRFSLKGESVILARASVINNSDFPHEIEFVAYGAGTNGFTENAVFPVDKGILNSKQIMRLFPEADEDLPSRISEMPFPWRGVTGSFGTVLVDLSGWDGFYYGYPKTDIKIVEPGKTIHSPLIRQIADTGRFVHTFRYAKAIGWNTGPEPDEESLVDFPIIELPPISEPGCGVRLTNPVRGTRSSSIMVDGETVAEGKPELNESLETSIQADGLHAVRFRVCGREQERRIYIEGRSGEVKNSKESGYLNLSNEYLELSINPAARGHVNSLRIDDCEWLLSSDPEPGTFAFQKPWFGGILPGYSHRGRFMDPCKLEEIQPDCSLVEEETWNIRYPSWQLTWLIDDEKKGSVNLVWKVGLFPSLPLLKTTVEIEQLAGSRPQGMFMCRGFFAPGGDTEGSVLHYHHRMPTFQGRDHEGNWTVLRSPLRVSSPAGQYIELHSLKENLVMAEDYAALGCHISTFSLRFPPMPLECFWLFSSGKEHEDISEVLKEYFEQKIIE